MGNPIKVVTMLATEMDCLLKLLAAFPWMVYRPGSQQMAWRTLRKEGWKTMGPIPIHSFEKNAPVYLEGTCQEQMDINGTKKLLPSVIKLEREDQLPLHECGSRFQKQQWLLAHCHTEPKLIVLLPMVNLPVVNSAILKLMSSCLQTM